MMRWTLSQQQSLAFLWTSGRGSDPRMLTARLLGRCSHAYSTLAQQETGAHAQGSRRPDSSRPVTDELQQRRKSGTKAPSSGSGPGAARREDSKQATD